MIAQFKHELKTKVMIL